jgi:hypothetical protein
MTWSEPAPYRRRFDGDYCRKKARLCRDLAARPAHLGQVKVLMRMAARFDARANGLEG